MRPNIGPPKLEYDDRTGPILTIWDQWQPACDACGRLESSLKKKQLLCCAGCLLAKYCSKECQKQNWNDEHKNQCHLFEADRKLSTVFAKSLGPGTVNDPTLSLAEKGVQWNFLNAENHAMIACAALKNDPEMAKSVNVGIFLKLVEDRTDAKYNHRSFIIEKVAFFPRAETDDFAKEAGWTKGTVPPGQAMDAGEHSKLMVGFCRFPNGQEGQTQMWIIPVGPLLTDPVLPPGFNFHRYITHVNRGITHFHASFWPVPRNISDADLEAAVPPLGWAGYAWRNYVALSGLTGQGVIGIEHPDGSRTPIYKWSQNGHFRRCAPGETDTDGPEEFKKLLVDPSRMVRMLYPYLELLKVYQDEGLKTTEQKFRGGMAALEKLKEIVHPTN
ncbi:hypothetical protein B0H19DRAFT_1248788 [Mycena capillaripes]|nr:hypothetical protein B0H19DRAFT_1248788 [Mycena capillaripes]